jgi:hypothetical protein
MTGIFAWLLSLYCWMLLNMSGILVNGRCAFSIHIRYSSFRVFHNEVQYSSFSESVSSALWRTNNANTTALRQPPLEHFLHWYNLKFTLRASLHLPKKEAMCKQGEFCKYIDSVKKTSGREANSGGLVAVFAII